MVDVARHGTVTNVEPEVPIKASVSFMEKKFLSQP